MEDTNLSAPLGLVAVHSAAPPMQPMEVRAPVEVLRENSVTELNEAAYTLLPSGLTATAFGSSSPSPEAVVQPVSSPMQLVKFRSPTAPSAPTGATQAHPSSATTASSPQRAPNARLPAWVDLPNNVPASLSPPANGLSHARTRSLVTHRRIELSL